VPLRRKPCGLIVVVMKLAMLVAVLAGCGTNDPGPHDVGACSSDWQQWAGTLQGFGAAGCERACATPPGNYLGSGATCNVGSAAPSSQCTYFENTEGTKGCCEVQQPIATKPIGFFECETQ